MEYKLYGIIAFLSFVTLFEACVIGENSFSFAFSFSLNSFSFDDCKLMRNGPTLKLRYSVQKYRVSRRL